MPNFPLSVHDCNELTQQVFNSLAARTQTDVIYSLYKQHIDPHVDRIPECVYIDLSDTIAPIPGFFSFNGIYSPPLLYNLKTHHVCEYRSELIDQETWTKGDASTPIISYIDNRILYDYKFWIWRRNTLEEKHEELLAHMHATEGVLHHYRNFHHFFVILVKENFANTVDGIKLQRRIYDRVTKTVIVVSDLK